MYNMMTVIAFMFLLTTIGLGASFLFIWSILTRIQNIESDIKNMQQDIINLGRAGNSAHQKIENLKSLSKGLQTHKLGRIHRRG